jgi:hypothetical protein
MQLYRGKVYDSCLAHYADAASFEDPAISLKGVKEMKRVFSARKCLNPVQLSGEIEYSPERIRIRLIQQVGCCSLRTAIARVTHPPLQYTIPLSAPFNMPSLVILEIDENEKITKHEELWNGQPLLAPAGASRRLNGFIAANIF